MEYGHTERSNDRAAADAVGPTDDTHHKSKQKHGRYAEPEVLAPELILNDLQIEGDGLDHSVRRQPCRDLGFTLFLHET